MSEVSHEAPNIPTFQHTFDELNWPLGWFWKFSSCSYYSERLTLEYEKFKLLDPQPRA
jgi:hypothetical protein